MIEAIGERLRSARESLELDQKGMADLLGTSLRTYQRYEAGEPPKLAHLDRLLDLGYSGHWLLTGQGPMKLEAMSVARQFAESSRNLARRKLIEAEDQAVVDALRLRESSGAAAESAADEFVLVPRYDVQAAMGPGMLSDASQIIDHLAFKRDWVRRLGADPAKVVLITGVGDSMEDTIRSGDLLLVDTGVTEFVDDAIYFIGRGDHLVVKRVQSFFNGAVVIKSDNPAYELETLTAEEAEAVRVIGRVRWIARMI